MNPLRAPVDPARSRNMRAVRAKDARPELVVRRLLHRLGYRYRLHVPGLPGRPDIVFPSSRRVIFVHGCFWHRHENCRHSSVPKTRSEWWDRKLSNNRARDARTMSTLAEQGWRAKVIWECETLRPESYLREVIRSFFSGPDLPNHPISVDTNVSESGLPNSNINHADISVGTHEGTKTMAPKSNRSNKAGAAVGKSSRKKPPSAKPTSAKSVKTSTKDVKTAARTVSAQQEHKLPSRYEASSDVKAGIVTIRHGSRSVRIKMPSFASVANALELVDGSKGRLNEGDVLKLSDASGRSVSIAAGALSDVASALGSLIAVDASKIAPVVSTTKPAAGSAKSTSTPKATTKTHSPAKPSIKAVKAPKPAKPAAPSSKAKASDDTMPGWFAQGYQDEYKSEQGKFRLVRKELALDPENHRLVKGEAGKAVGTSGWGYEVIAGNKHIAWVIAEDERSFVLTGALDFPPSAHRILEGLMARLISTVMPAISEAA